MDIANSNGIQTAGDVDCKEIWLIDTKNKNARINLLNMFVDFTVYEDIFSPILSGYVALIESQNLIESVPIVGGEMIIATFATPSMKEMTFEFFVTKVGTREHQDKTNMYTLEFVSYQGYVDMNKRVSKVYSGNTSVIAYNAFKEHFGNTLVDIDQSDNVIKFISPYWSPMKIINYVACFAQHPNRSITTPNFLFYQTNKGHKFKSLTTLFAQAPISEYFFDKNPARLHADDGTSVRDIEREYKTIKELTFVESNDYIKQTMNGAYNHRVFGVDIYHKKFALKTYSYQDAFHLTEHTDKSKLSVMPMSKASGLHSIEHTYPNSHNGITDSGDELKAKRISLLAQLETFKLDIVVHGRTDFEVGKTIFIWLNKFKSSDDSDATAENYDTVYSGKYLVTAIQHRFTMTKHLMNMQVIKDSSFREITNK